MTPEQRKALDIGASVWVDASAGSGKTTLLVARMVRLLLSGIGGRTILCLTFTKIGAIEMQERLDQKLSRWFRCSQQELQQDLAIILGHSPSHDTLACARSLYESYQKNPVTIQTFHSFCHDTLMRFPIESGVNIPLQILDHPSSVRLWNKALDGVLRHMDPLSSLGQMVQRMMDSGVSLTDVLTQWFEQRLLPRPDYDLLAMNFSIQDFLQIRPNIMPQPDVLNPSDQKWCDQLRDIPRGSVAYCGLILAKIPKKSALHHPRLQQWHQQEILWMQELVQWQNRKKQATKEHDLTMLFQSTMAEYTRNKQGSLDFDDLTIKTLDLMEHTLYSGWVGHTLYQTIEHILVDEAQDTSRHQWKILRVLIEAIMQKPHRTVCVVGDPKQSIYGFQGADPEGFFLMRQFIKAWVLSQSGLFYDVSLTISFRSAPVILNVVNAVFTHAKRTGMDFLKHTSIHQGRPGRVTLWAHTGQGLEYGDLSAAWVSTLKGLLQEGDVLPSQNRPVQAKDIMIILPRRTTFFKILQDQLYESGLLTGKDMTCKDNPVLAMMVAWCRMVVHGDNDMALAHILSGMSRFSKECLVFSSAYQRGRRSIWQNISNQSEHQFFSAFSRYIRNISGVKTSLRLLDLVVHWIYVDGGMTFLSALIPDKHSVQNAVDVFIHALQTWHDPEDAVGFLDWMVKSDTVFKNPMGGGIRLLTIHGAKGTQAPIVILPDLPESVEKDDPEYWRLLYVAMTRAQDRLYISSCKSISPWYQAIEEAMMGCATLDGQNDGGNLPIASYVLSHTLPDTVPETGLGDAGSLPVSHHPEPDERLERSGAGQPSHMHPTGRQQNTDQKSLWGQQKRPFTGQKPVYGSFSWLLSGMADNDWGDPTLPNHQPVLTENKAVSFSRDAFFYRRRGECLHQLLDELPRSDPQHWYTFAWRFLYQQGMGQAQSDIWAKRVVDLLQHPLLQPLFFQAKSEVEWCGPGHIRRMDRVLVGEADLWIVDFKSTRMTESWDSMPYGHQMQMYADLMGPIYPTKRIHQGILWLKQGILQWHPQSHCWSQCGGF
jgi:ATP-dependent helicase/nuclease subunit A